MITTTYALVAIDGAEENGFAILDELGQEIATTPDQAVAELIVEALNA